MPDYINQELLKRRLLGMQVPNPFTPMEEPPPDTVESIPVPQPRAFAPTATQEKARQLAETMPSLTEGEPGYRREYAHPGKLNRLSAILSGMSAGIKEGGGAGAATARSIRLAPYNEALSEWDMKRKALEPLAKMEIEQAGLGQEQYRTEMAGRSAAQRNMTAQELNTIRREQAAEVQRMNTAKLEYQGTGTQMEQWYEKRAQLAADKLKEIDSTIAGQKSVARIRETGATERATTGRTSAEGIAAANRTSREAIEAARETGRTERYTPPKDYTPINEVAKEALEATRLITENPQWKDFVQSASDNPLWPGKTDFKVKSATEILKDPVTQLEYKKFLRTLRNRMGKKSYTVETLDENEEDQ